MIKILLVDDHSIIRNGLRAMLESSPKISVIGEAENGLDAFEKIKMLQPDVVLSDISMSKMNGLELLRKLEKEIVLTKVIILSVHEDEEYIVNSIAHGANGYLLKDCERSELITAVEKVASGKKYYSAHVSSTLANRYKKDIEMSSVLRDTKLTEREHQILKYIVQGFSNKQLAELLFLSNRTIDSHRYSIMKKLNVKNLAELIQKSLKLKLTELVQ